MRNRLMLTVCAVTLFLGTVGSAAADNAKTNTNISSFHSRAELQGSVTPKATCQGTDGTYTLLAVSGRGSMTSTDPRMSGIFTADALILDSPVTGLGVSVDNWTVTDPATGAVKAKGRAIATDLGPNPRAITYATLADGSRMIANTLVTLPAPGTTDPLVIEYGGAGLQAPDRGVIVSGKSPCIKLLLSQIFDE